MKHLIQPIQMSASVEALLSACHLPTADLNAGSKVTLFGCISGAEVSGIVGLELYDSTALLRSLAVLDTGRGRGLGKALVAYAEEFAAQQGVRSIYLLTTTASEFFERLGYQSVAREQAPASVARTSQFSELCPASSAFMAKSLEAKQIMEPTR